MTESTGTTLLTEYDLEHNKGTTFVTTNSVFDHFPRTAPGWDESTKETFDCQGKFFCRLNVLNVTKQATVSKQLDNTLVVRVFLRLHLVDSMQVFPHNYENLYK